MKKILVTGATGFLGAYLIKQLIHQETGTIVGLKRANSSAQLLGELENQIQWVEGDILDVLSMDDAFAGIDEVYHTAALISYHPRFRKEMKKVNIEGTANVVNQCLKHKVGKLLHVSSIAAIGRLNGQLEVSESNKWNTWNGTSLYGKTKQRAELEVYRGIAEGLQANIVNPSVIIGPGFWDRGSAQFFPRVHKGQKLYPVGATGFVDVRDVATLCIRLMNRRESNGQRVIANGVNLSFLEFFNILARHLKVKGPSIKVNNFMAGLAWRTEAIRSRLFNTAPFLTRETAAASMSSYKFDNSLSQSLFSILNIESLRTR